MVYDIGMNALCMIKVSPGKVDNVVKILHKKRKPTNEVMIVTGQADICVIFDGKIDEINKTVIDYKKINDIVSTETLIEVEVDLGW